MRQRGQKIQLVVKKVITVYQQSEGIGDYLLDFQKYIIRGRVDWTPTKYLICTYMVITGILDANIHSFIFRCVHQTTRSLPDF